MSVYELLKYARGFAFGILHIKITLHYILIKNNELSACFHVKMYTILAVSKFIWISIYS